jgi:hypothetical protein
MSPTVDLSPEEFWERWKGSRIDSLLPIVSFSGLVFLGVFAFFKTDYRLNMTDDYAAMSSAAILVILVLGFVEMHALAKSTQRLVCRAREAGVDTDRDTLETRMVKAQLRSLWLTGSTWSLLCFLMTAALILTFLWAAIDGHGPARLLAGYTLVVTITGLMFVLATAIAKVQAEFRTTVFGSEFPRNGSITAPTAEGPTE